MNLQALLDQAVAFHQNGRLAEAEGLYAQLLAAVPDHPALLFNHGTVLKDLKRHQEALADFDKALALQPDFVPALNNRGGSLKELKRFREALADYDKAVALQPGDPGLLLNRGLALSGLERFEDALASFDQALALAPDYAEALNNRGLALCALKCFTEALASYDKALSLNPRHAVVLNNRGLALADMARFEDALADYETALAVDPKNVELLNNRGLALSALNRFEAALTSYGQALAVNPRHAGVLNNRGLTLARVARFEAALASYDAALAVVPDYDDALYNRGQSLLHLKRLEEALASYEKALALNPSHPDALSGVAEVALRLCDWRRAANIAPDLAAAVRADKAQIPPFVVLGYSSDPMLQLRCAKNAIRSRIPVLPPPLWSGEVYRNRRIKLAYLSADFHDHATANLMAELFERHDRARFEVWGLSFGPDDGSATRARLIKGFDLFVDVREKSDLEIARHLRANRVDIAIDLKGHTQNDRPGIFSHRPSPVQAAYLGYPGTCGAAFMDYVIADPIVAPLEQQAFFSEKIVHLPDCYQVNDSQRAIAKQTLPRQAAGLPDRGFVFCCFNNSWKITAPVFDVWMRLLGAVPGSVLWLMDRQGAGDHLRAEAAARGIDPARLVFAGRMKLEDHLARHRLADLFLDTLPYNAHTTASDALWTGLPLVTCKGESFAGRVAASLLHAIGLPELVTDTLEDYESLALKLARDGALLRAVGQKLERNRLTTPLFDSERFRRHIESAYMTMRDIAERGEAPRAFRVEPAL
jgi:predicted O-linked N-acetylglucosamine transferase (SPINDLY family)